MRIFPKTGKRVSVPDDVAEFEHYLLRMCSGINCYLYGRMYAFSKYREQYRANLRLALPVVIAQLGQILVQFADNVMVGRYGGDDALPLASVAFGSSASFLFFIAGLGITFGLTPLIGELFVRGETRRSSSYLKHSLVMYGLFGVGITLLQLLFAPMLYRMGQPVEVVDMALPYYRYLAFSMLPVMLFGSFKQFLEGVGNTVASMVIILGCNLLNILLNWIFINGELGAPEMGGAGAGLATMISRAVMPVAAFVYFMVQERYRRYLRLFPSLSLRRARFNDLFKMGLPIAAQMFLEAAAFVITSVMMGWFDVVAISSNQIAMTLGNCAFMIVTAVGAATTIRVSHCYGARNIGEMSLAAKASLHIVLLWNTLAIVAFVSLRHLIPHLFTSNAAVIDMTALLLVFVSLYQLSDGLQCVAIGIMRGFQDVKVIPWISFLAYIVLNLPVGYLFGFTLGMGPCGLYIGYFVGLTTSAVLLLLRIKRKVRYLRQHNPA